MQMTWTVPPSVMLSISLWSGTTCSGRCDPAFSPVTAWLHHWHGVATPLMHHSISTTQHSTALHSTAQRSTLLPHCWYYSTAAKLQVLLQRHSHCHCYNTLNATAANIGAALVLQLQQCLSTASAAAAIAVLDLQHCCCTFCLCA